MDKYLGQMKVVTMVPLILMVLPMVRKTAYMWGAKNLWMMVYLSLMASLMNSHLVEKKG
jgi:beta-lactamase regulating signal transducer with metallopeptidase domain